MRDLVKRYLLGIVVCTIALSSTLLTLAPSASADAPHEIRNAAEAIPQLSENGQTYKSWSLFLVCNPAWVLPESTRRLGELYQNFQAFGKAIGPAHAAVWFGVPSANDKQVQVDVLRSAAFCESLKLARVVAPTL